MINDQQIQAVNNYCLQFCTGCEFGFTPNNLNWLLDTYFNRIPYALAVRLSPAIKTKQSLYVASYPLSSDKHSSIQPKRWYAFLYGLFRKIPPRSLLDDVGNGEIFYLPGFGWKASDKKGKSIIGLFVEDSQINYSQLSAIDPVVFDRFVADDNPIPSPKGE